ncbi:MULTISPECIES: IMPACT family protein [Spiroplasma]|uniref:IMPACT family protein n=1 Tax=Spiroplasma TaxID=2132 RepID=UPI0018DD5E55|nr:MULTISPECIES: YigZ family protein [Spiroplasma]MBH8622985.1 YigZ family protein [Spiroplasma sp. hyd1]UNF61202.1 YigZ family protein [Spiroplasma poulsonii]
MQELKENKIIIGEMTIKKSRFICLLQKVTSEQAALAFIKTNQQLNANHNCYAYIIGKNQNIMRKYDDGEPSNTAGKPILDILLHHHLTNVVCLVIRYFGGIKLGAGGLIRAYANSVKMNLKNSELIPFLETKEIIIQFPISKIKLVDEYLTYHYSNIKIKKTFNESISYTFSLATTEIPRLTLWTNNNAINLILSEHKDS